MKNKDRIPLQVVKIDKCKKCGDIRELAFGLCYSCIKKIHGLGEFKVRDHYE